MPEPENANASPLTRAVLMGARLWRGLRSYRLDVPLLAVTAWRAVFPGRPARSGDVDSPREIAVVRLDAMGDLIMTTPLFREFRVRFPSARIVAVVQGRNRVLLENSPFVDEVVCPAEVRGSRILLQTRRGMALVALFRRRLRGRAFDIAVQPRLDRDYYSSTVLLKLLNAPLTVKFLPERRESGLAAAVESLAARRMLQVARPAAEKEALANLRIAQAVTGVAPTSVPEIFLTKAERKAAREWFATAPGEGPAIAVSFGAQAARRIWPIARWAEALREICAGSGVNVVLICSRAEQEQASQLIASVPYRIELFAGHSLRQVAACLERCVLFIGPDSGLAHLAAAVGCPPLVISPHPRSGDPAHENSPVRFLPLHPEAEVLQPDAPLQPCREGCDAITAHCILQISPSQVAGAALRKLRATPHAGRRI